MILDNEKMPVVNVLVKLFHLAEDRTEAIKILINNGVGFGDLEAYFDVSDGEFDEAMDEIYYDTLRSEIGVILGKDKDRAYAMAKNLDFEGMVTNEFTYRGGDMCDIDEELLDECIKDCYIESVR